MTFAELIKMWVEEREKAITTTTLATGGLFEPEDADRFITSLIDQSQILGMVQTYRMRSSERHIDVIGIAGRQLRKKAEGVSPTQLATITTSRNSLHAVETIMPFEVTDAVFRENIEKENFEDLIMAQFTLATGNDFADLAWNGDTAATGTDADFLKINDGWIKLLKARANTFDTNGSTNYDGVIFPGMFKALPARYKKNRRQLRFIVGLDTEEDIRTSYGERISALGDDVLETERPIFFHGVQIVGMDYFPENTYLLGNPLNLAWGIETVIQIERDRDIYKGVRQYAITSLNDSEIAIDDAMVIGYDIP